MSQIRLSRTHEIDTVLSFLRSQYPLLSEAEIIKMVLSEKYRETKRKSMSDEIINQEERKLEKMLLDGVRSERSMEIGSEEWKDFRRQLRNQKKSKNK